MLPFGALLAYNDFGYETDDPYTVAAAKRQVTLDFLDDLLGAGVPVHALGIQAHLTASPRRSTRPATGASCATWPTATCAS